MARSFAETFQKYAENDKVPVSSLKELIRSLFSDPSEESVSVEKCRRKKLYLLYRITYSQQ